MKKWILSLIVIILLVSTAYFVVFKTNQSDAKGKVYAVVKRVDLVQRVTIAGTIVPKRKTLITAPYDGYIQKLFVAVGDKVKRRDPIVTLTQSLLSGEEVFPIRAPFPGVVVQVRNQSGEYVKANDQNNYMVRIDDLSELLVEANVPEIDYLKIKLGQEAVIKASAVLGKKYKGRISEVSIAAMESSDWSNKGKVEYPIKLVVVDPDEQIKPGMSALVDVTAQKLTNVLTLRHEFIRKEDEGYFVTLESGEQRAIKVGLQNEVMFEIKEGLKEGEKVRQTDFYELYQENRG